MPLLVLCPHCKARFQVSEKFAGKEGPCPKCKGKITIPKLEEQVQVHAPESFAGAGKDAAGRQVLKPIAREKTRLNTTLLGGVIGATVAVFAMAFVLRIAFPEGPPTVLIAIGLIIVTPPLVYGGYFFLRNDELEPYRGKALYIRCLICSTVYAALWGGFMFLPESMQIWQWVYFGALFVVPGLLASLATLDLEPANAFFHYAFYVVVTLLLRVAMGLPALKVSLEGVAR